MANVRHFTLTDGSTVDIPIDTKAYVMKFTLTRTAFQLWHGTLESSLTADSITDLSSGLIVPGIPTSEIDKAIVFIHLFINNKNFLTILRKNYVYNSTSIQSRSIVDTLRVEWSTPIYLNIEGFLDLSGTTVNTLLSLRLKVSSVTDAENLDINVSVASGGALTFDSPSNIDFFISHMRQPRVYFEPAAMYADPCGFAFADDNGNILNKSASYIFGTYGSDTTTYFKVIHYYRIANSSTVSKLTQRFRNSANNFRISFDSTGNTWS